MTYAKLLERLEFVANDSMQVLHEEIESVCDDAAIALRDLTAQLEAERKAREGLETILTSANTDVARLSKHADKLALALSNARRQERERCAKACIERAGKCGHRAHPESVGDACAAAIRALGEG